MDTTIRHRFMVVTTVTDTEILVTETATTATETVTMATVTATMAITAMATIMAGLTAVITANPIRATIAVIETCVGTSD